jgi:hypothetical protein
MRKEDGKVVHPNDRYGTIEASYVAARDSLRAVVTAAKSDINGLFGGSATASGTSWRRTDFHRQGS